MPALIGQAADWQAGEAYIGYQNMLEGDGVSITSSVAGVSGYELKNIVDWGIDRYEVVGTSTIYIYITLAEYSEVNSLGLYGHNLPTGGMISLAQVTSLENDDWLDIPLTITAPASDGKTIFTLFSATDAKYFRVKMVNIGNTTRLTNLFLGDALRLYSSPTVGWVPTDFARNNKIITTRTDGGKFLGRTVIERGNKTGFKMSIVPSDWARDYWLPFMIHAERKPFYFAWSAVHEPTDAAFCYTEKAVRPPMFKSVAHMSISLDFIAL